MNPDPAVASAYRDHLVPLVAGWRRRGARVAVFGTGPHTADLLALVPELEEPLVAYLDSQATDDARYRGRPLVRPEHASSVADVVVCSSYGREPEQLRLMDQFPVKTYLSHPPHISAAAVPDFLLVPTYGYPVITPTSADEPIDAVRRLFDADMDRFRAELAEIVPYFSELDDVPAEAEDDVTPSWNNAFFRGNDARVAYGTVRAHRPARILEIGSGTSTKFMRRAIAQNGGETTITSIDPHPRAAIDSLCDRVIRRPLQRVELGTFDVLEAGDILFMDGTHQVFRGTDSTFFYLQVLPRLKPGVRVHVHDITLPFEYSDDFAVRRYYAEQYVVAALLLGGGVWRTTMPVSYLCHLGLLLGEADDMARAATTKESWGHLHAGTSLWMVKAG